MFALRSKTQSIIVKDGIFKTNPDIDCPFCNAAHPFDFYNIVYECPLFYSQRSQYLGNFPDASPDSIHLLFENTPIHKIFHLYSYFSKCYKAIQYNFSL